jgi:Mg-chelatase subunit ChlD
MYQRSLRTSCGAFAVLALLGAAEVRAQGTVIIDRPVPHPRWPQRVTTTPLELRYQTVEIEITDGVAVTTLQQTFRNPLLHPVEGEYVFPLPQDVAVGEFAMTMGGRTLKGEVLDADQARQTYEQIVRRARDPGLLELLGARLYRARLFPIPAGGGVEVKLQYSTTLSESAGLGLLRHPLATAQAGAPIERLLIRARVRSAEPLASVFCPSHTAEITRPGDREALVTVEQNRVWPDRDFLLYYQRKEAAYGLSLLTHRTAGEPGYFLLRLSPRVEPGREDIQPKDIAFVVDTSGSMAGEKIAQLRRALRHCIETLSPEDRFNILAFSTSVRPLREGLVAASSDMKEAARSFADSLEAGGGTNIDAALRAALEADPRDGQRPYLIVFMTDGLPTVEVTDPQQILRNVEQRNSHRVRFHVLGVGSDVNVELLDKLAETNRGSREYCTEKEDLEIKLGGLAARLSSPLLTDLTLAIDGARLADVYPNQIPDLFRGGEIVVLGRYCGPGHHLVRLEGRTREGERTIQYEATFPERCTESEFLPRLWATRKIAYLLDQIRLHGESSELKAEVVRLATRHGIVTPYTAALIVEDERPLAMRPQADAVIAGRLRAGAEGAPGRGRMEPRRGAGAIDPKTSPRFGGGIASREISLERQRAALGSDLDGIRSDGLSIRHVGEKTFVLDGKRWIDSLWDGKSETRKIEAFSDEYFKLLRDRPELARCFALGDRVVVVLDRQAYEVVPPQDESRTKP